MRHLLVLPCFILVSLPRVYAQNDAAENQSSAPTLRSTTHAVVVDVVVTNSKDDSISALHQQDFVVNENGKPQTIDFFEEHTDANAPVATLPTLPPHVYSNQPFATPNDAVNIFLLDSLNTTEADQARIHKQILEFLSRKNPDTRIAIFALNARLRMLQGFTADSTLLKAAINSKAAMPGTNVASRSRDDDLSDQMAIASAGSAAASQSMARSLGEYSGTQATRRVASTFEALQQLVRALGAIPGRKNVLWFASSFPVAVFPNEISRSNMEDRREIPATLRQTVDLLTAGKVAIYPISAQGILVDPTTDVDSGIGSSGVNASQSYAQYAAANNADTAAMEKLATGTGGKAIYSTNNLSQALAHDIANGEHYYTLTYTPTDSKPDGKFRRIDVRLAQGNYKLAYRRGYFADDASTLTQTKPAADPLAPLLAHGIPSSTQIVYQVRVLPSATQPPPGAPRAGGNTKLPGQLKRYKVEFVISAAGLSLEPLPNGAHTAKIEVALVAYGRDGAAVNWTGGSMTMTLNAASYAKAQQTGIAAPMEIDLPDTDVSLATGIYDLSARKAGTLEIPLSPAALAPTAPGSN